MHRLTTRQSIEITLARALLGAPSAVVAKLAGPPIERDGRLLDRQAQLSMKMAIWAGRRPTHQHTVASARADFESMAIALAPRAPALAEVTDLTWDGPSGSRPARLYRPLGDARGALVYYHGGGWVIGSLNSYDAICRALAAKSGCTVVSIDYRLAPEHPFPAAVDDAIAAFRWAVSAKSPLGREKGRVAVGGDSAGGNLSAVVSLETRKDEVRPCFQLLIYPGVDVTQSFPSIRTLGQGFFLEKASIDWFLSHYVPKGQSLEDPRLSPWFAPDVSGAPPAFVLTAGFDPLRDEGDAYAKKLADAGARVEHRCYGSLFHGFMNASGGIRACAVPLEDAARALKAALGG